MRVHPVGLVNRTALGGEVCAVGKDPVVPVRLVPANVIGKLRWSDGDPIGYPDSVTFEKVPSPVEVCGQSRRWSVGEKEVRSVRVGVRCRYGSVPSSESGVDGCGLLGLDSGRSFLWLIVGRSGRGCCRTWGQCSVLEAFMDVEQEWVIQEIR